ncbi:MULTISPECIES: triphosphoribosyl-dephospho-CoA synthase MdcB [unclassified Variovorax]|uniref:triphosphoribosyl-dephospho-CoA synthase MdcB n=1 Tax=unclassified Variovorax TaxID=663243 RepID=UPI003F475655
MKATVAGHIPSPAQNIAALAAHSLRLEVRTWPKPGLVSHVDTGSHTDMDAGTFERSASALRPFFAELFEAGARNHDMPALRKIGLRAECAMVGATGGVNTHRGAIFGMGLLCAAAGLRDSGGVGARMSLGDTVSRRWGTDILGGPRPSDSHGEAAKRRYGAGGARQEAAQGFASVYDIGLPALRLGARLAPDDAQAARVQCCFALIAVLEDTNLLHRGGPAGLRFAQRSAQAFLAAGGVGQPGWRQAAEQVHRAFVARRLSPGGAADLLAMSVFAMALEPGAGA